jgi:hypothetical protein
MKKLIPALAVVFLSGTMFMTLQAEETTTVPYKKFEGLLKVGTSKEFENIKYTALYLSHTREGKILNPELAKFRIRTKDGKEVLLKWEALSDIPEAELTPADKEKIEDGSTHRLWVPKDLKKYAESDLVWNLPKGSVNVSAIRAQPFRIPLNSR